MEPYCILPQIFVKWYKYAMQWLLYLFLTYYVSSILIYLEMYVIMMLFIHKQTKNVENHTWILDLDILYTLENKFKILKLKYAF